MNEDDNIYNFLYYIKQKLEDIDSKLNLIFNRIGEKESQMIIIEEGIFFLSPGELREKLFIF